jgi:hypothetical protein
LETGHLEEQEGDGRGFIEQIISVTGGKIIHA